MALSYKAIGVAVAFVTIVVALVQRAFRVKHDPREPPVVSSSIPLIGHLLGMIKNGTNYIDMLW
jgi:hypothetical protein